MNYVVLIIMSCYIYMEHVRYLVTWNLSCASRSGLC